MEKLKSSGDYIDFIAENCDVDKLWLIGLSNQAKKEVFDDIDKLKLNYQGSHKMIDEEDYQELKQRHLSTFPEEKQHN